MSEVATELDGHVAALFLRALQREAEADGFTSHYHFREPGGTDVREYRRADELLILKSRDVLGHRLRVDVESETFDVRPLVERAAGRAAAEVLEALIGGLGQTLGQETRAKLRREVQALLNEHA